MAETAWERSRCLCGASEDVPLFERRDLMFEGTERFRVVRCTRCAIERLDPRPTVGSILAFYGPAYEPYERPAGTPRSWLARLRARDQRYGLQKRLRAVERFQPEGGRLLDVGAASGAFLAEVARSPRWQGEGVEPNAPVAEAAAARGLAVRASTVEAARFPDGAFDAVTLWDVIEHLHDPAATVREIARVLKPGGVLVMSTPNLASWDRKLFGKEWLGYELPRHLYLFDPTSARALLEANGFEWLGARSFFGSHSYFMSSLDFWLKERPAPPLLRRLIGRVAFSVPSRLLLAPYFWLADRRLRTTTMTLFARRCMS